MGFRNCGMGGLSHMGASVPIVRRAFRRDGTRIALLFVASALLPSAGTADPLAPSGTPRGCFDAPAPIVDLAMDRPYSDGIGSTADAALQAKHAAEAAPLKAWLSGVVKAADAGDARCAARLLAHWARAGALLGQMRTKQAEYERKWTLAGAALAWIKVRREASDAERRDIDAWLHRLADASHRFAEAPGLKRNNHWYWLGLGLGAVALATGDEQRWKEAHAIYSEALAAIAPDGTLPLEMARGRRALHYHGFALMPLVTLAELAASRGEDWYAVTGGSLHLLVAATLAGHRDPERFARLAGVAQEAPVNPGAGWLHLYRRRFPERIAGPLPNTKRAHRWLGGDVERLSAALRPSVRHR